MESIDIKRLALILALQAEIEGMKAENKQREIMGESMAYTGISFLEKANELRDLAYKHNDQL